MSKQENRSQSKKHELRARKKAEIFWGCEGKGLDKAGKIGRKTRTPCSCGMCGNPRRKGYKLSQCARKQDLIDKIKDDEQF